MSYRRIAFRFSSSLALASLLTIASAACSSSSAGDTPDAQPADDAQVPADADMTLDAKTDAPLTDAGTGVWRADSTAFELTSSGGFVAPPPPDSGCTMGDLETWDYDAASRELTQAGCSAGGSSSVDVILTAAAAAELEARLTALQAKPATTGACGADAPDVLLTVKGPGTATRAYPSDFYSGCPGFDAGATLFISFQALGDLMADLHGYTAACQADGGTAGDAGASCVVHGGDAGADAGPKDASTGD